MLQQDLELYDRFGERVLDSGFKYNDWQATKISNKEFKETSYYFNIGCIKSALIETLHESPILFQPLLIRVLESNNSWSHPNNNDITLYFKTLREEINSLETKKVIKSKRLENLLSEILQIPENVDLEIKGTSYIRRGSFLYYLDKEKADQAIREMFSLEIIERKTLYLLKAIK